MDGENVDGKSRSAWWQRINKYVRVLVGLILLSSFCLLLWTALLFVGITH